MSEKRRGLGRGLGALIPTGPDGSRPVDVFFASSDAAGDSATAPVSSLAVATEKAIAKDGLNRTDTSLRGSATETRPKDPDEAKSRNHQNDVKQVLDVASPDGSTADVSRETSSAGSEGIDDTSTLVPVPGATFANLPIESIRPNSRQPRTVFDEAELAELVESIKTLGVLQPIVVRPDPEDADGYELIMGERRLRAAREAGLTAMPAIVRDTENADMLRDALLENLHRSDLNPLEEAAAYRQLLDDFGCTHEELADRLARSRPQISNTLRLLKLPPLVQRRVAAGVLSAGHARALLGLTDGGEIERLAQRIVAEGLSVRATEEVVALGGEDQGKTPRRQPRPGQRSAAVDDLAARLSDRFETRVRVDLGKRKGKLTVEFASVEDLNRILDILAPEDPGLLRS